MILKIILGSGGRGLLNYISQLSKAPIHRPHNNLQIYEHIHLPDLDQHPQRRSQPAAGIDQLPHLSQLNVVHDSRSFNVRWRDRDSESLGEVFLQGHARIELDGRHDSDANGVRRPGDRPGPAAIEKSGGRRSVKNISAPPTFSTFAGTTARDIAAEFGALRKLKPNLGKAVAHLILSPGPDDRELSKEEWLLAMDLALAEHGAADAPRAAWLHHDTGVPHLHVFYSRITPAGQVISDSNSFQKNRIATRKITQELKLTPLPSTPASDAPGDRQVAENAARRAERLGEQLIDPKIVRSILTESTSVSEFTAKLAEMGIEAEFQRRGPEQNIYGWKLRWIGQVEWMKASTLSKDLSWPKIAHRFAESDSTKETQTPAPKSVVSLVESAAPALQQQDRTPAMLRPILQKQAAAKQLRSLGDVVATEEPELFQAVRTAEPQTKFAALLKALALLAIEAIKFSEKILKAILSFLRSVLAAFGIGLREPALQSYEHPQPEQLTFEPFEISETAAAPSLNDNTDQAAAAAVTMIAEALKSNTPELLPVAPGRAELVQALKEKATKTTVGAGAIDAMAQVFSPTETEVPVPAETLQDPIVSLKQSGEEYLAAVEAVVSASQKPDLGVTAARKKLEAAEREFTAAQAEYEPVKAKFNIFGSRQKTRFLEAEKILDHAQKSLAAAEAARESAPKPDAPPAVSSRFKTAHAEFQKDGLSVVAAMQEEANRVDDAAVKKFALKRADTVKAALAQVTQLYSSSELTRALKTVKSTRAEVAARLAEIERLKEAERQRDASHEAPAAHDMGDGFQRPT